ncbi:acetyl-CoA synthetase-like protein [Penicillium lividum]|nr:acetyl-CoA synthetase-like protein [Penicillium lividum]
MKQEKNTTQGLGPDEWAQICEWNKEIPLKSESCIHEVILSRAQSLHPETTAIVSWDGTLTYLELMFQVDNVSRGLVSYGVKRGATILSCCDKSKHAVIAMIAILQAGAVWVPCETDLPHGRLRNVLDSTKPALIVGTSAATARYRQFELAPPLVAVEELLSHGKKADNEKVDLHLEADPSSPALMIFTSGSTGKRSGVKISHSAMVTAAISYSNTLELSTTTRMIQFSAFVWLPCTVEILATLMHGGQVFIPSEYERLNSASDFMRTHAINVAVMTPTFAATLDPGNLPNLRVLGLGGEKVSQNLVDGWSHVAKLVLCYGSTETNLCMLEWIQPGDYTVTAGLPCGCRAWITDPDDSNVLLPVGMEGELIIESHALATEYLDDPEKTESKFIDKTAWSDGLAGTARFCRTGDLARYQQDGKICILGRLDSDVKIRGQKVTLAEVEHHLRALLPSYLVVEAVRFKRQPDDMGQVLAAFLVIGTESQDTNNETFIDTAFRDQVWEMQQKIQPRLDTLLPQYMHPTVYMPVAYLPLLPSGKIDRQQLRSKASDLVWDDVIAVNLADAASTEQVTEQAPKNEIERKLHRLWCAQLGISNSAKLGRSDNFFRVGGDSLLAIRMVAAARELELNMHVQMIFEHPTLAELTSVVQPLAPSTMKAGASNPDEITKGISCLIGEEDCFDMPEVLEIYSATPLQEGLLALAMQKSGAYTVNIKLPLLDSVDLARFKETWEDLVRFLPILRTRFIENGHGIQQIVLNEEPEWSDEHSLSTWANSMTHGLLNGKRLHAYSIGSASSGIRSFQWAVHHSILDAWSMQLIFQLLETRYQGIITLPPAIKMQGLLQHISDIDPDASRVYWQSQLEEAHPLHWPPMPRPGYAPEADTTCRQKVHFQVPENSQFTTANILRAAWAVLLSRYADTEHVVFGVTLNGRSAPVTGLAELVAPTIVTVPVHIVVQPDQEFHQLLARVQAQATSMIPHEHTGLQNIRRLSPKIRRACDFQILWLVHNHAPEEALQFQGSTASVADWLSLGAYSLVMECELVPGGAMCHVTYDAQVFSSELPILSIIAQYEQMINQFCDDRRQKSVDQIDLCPETDWKLLRQHNSRIPQAATISAPCELQRLVAAAPSDAMAVAAWDGSLTLHELHEKSTRLAAHLVQKFGLGPDMIVPTVFPKSVWAVVSMMAIWKAGAAFASVDSSHPTSWIQHIIDKCECNVVLTAASVLPGLPRLADVSCLIVDETLIQSLSHSPTEESLACPSKISLDSAAYVIFTSGSTGTPKGIVHTHRSYMSGVQARNDVLYRRGERILQFASFSFDVSIDDICTTLILGGTVCIPSESERFNGLVDFMNQYRVTSAELTPSFARSLVPSSLPYLKFISLSGEPSTQEDKSRWLEAGLTVLDEYGPAEVAIKSNVKIVQATSSAKDKGLPVGCIAWITEPGNPHKLQEIGALGELLLEGPTLARCYLNDPVRTNLAFIHNPDWLPANIHGRRRMYRTGDLASYGPGGSIYIHGRQDTQVKVNGQRVELQQVEGRINSYFEHQWRIYCDMASMPTAQSVDEQRLVAYLATEGCLDHQQILEDVRNRCSSLYDKLLTELPRFMIPVAVIVVDLLPLNKSGKVNRSELKKMAIEAGSTIFLRTGDTAVFKQDSSQWTDVEKILASLWRQTLGLDEEHIINRHDSFFDLGGDSILAMRMVSSGLREPFFIRITVVHILQSPVLADMAMVAVLETPKDAASTPPITATPFEQVGSPYNLQSLLVSVSETCNVLESSIADIYPSSSIQEGIIAVSLKQNGFYMAQHVFRLPRDLNLDRLMQAWVAVIRRTTILRTRLVQYQDRMWQAVIDEIPVIERKTSSSLDVYLAQDRLNVMGLGQHMSRHSLITELGSDIPQTYLVWSIHHALYDGWSLGLILNSVNSVYVGKTAWSPLVEYRVFTKYLATIDSDAASAYWRSALASSQATCCPYPPLPSQSYQCTASASAKYQWKVPQSQLPGITLASILCASWALVSTLYSDTDDVVFGQTVNGRNVPCTNATKIEGPVFTTIPFRARISPVENVQMLLRRIQQDLVDMVPHQHLGLQNIARLDADCQAACQFNTQLVIQTPEDSKLYIQSMGERVLELVDWRLLNPYAIMLQLTPNEERMVEADVSFDPDLIHPDQMHRILRQLEAVSFRLCAATASEVVSQVTAITTADVAELMLWNEETPSPSLDNVADLFDKSCRLQPDAQAVCAWDGNLTYKELHHLSSHLSHQLRLLGAGREMVIPVCFEKSMYAVVATLAVLKAGAAFCLMDPSHPEKRLAGLIKETGARIVLASKQQEPMLRELEQDATLVVLDQELRNDILEPSLESTSNSIHPGDLACVLFTSGSTGKPKGILLQHQAICASIMSHGPMLEMGPDSRVFQFASHAFDMAIYDMLTTLVHGGCICIPSDKERVNDLAGSINRLKANWAFFTPSTLSLLYPHEVPYLRTIVVGGEALTDEVRSLWVDRVHLFQCSGPAETTISIAGRMLSASARNCIGRGVGSRCWIVDPSDHHRLQPIGVIGELLIEGPTLAREYLHDQTQTMASFILASDWAKEHSSLPERSSLLEIGPTPQRMFKTGDLVQHAPDGSLLFIGRNDSQIKIRGQRLQLSEVEGALSKLLPEYQVAVEIIAISRGDDRKSLCGFVARPERFSKASVDPHKPLGLDLELSSCLPSIDDIELALTETLPSYMIPQLLVPITQIPINSSGKVARKELQSLQSELSKDIIAFLTNRKPQLTKGTADSALTLEASPETLQLRRMWADVLRIDEQNIHSDDHFLRLGGDSVAAMRLVSRAQQVGWMLTVADVFQHPRLAKMALFLKVTEAPMALDYQPLSLLGGQAETAKIMEDVHAVLGVSAAELEDIYPSTALQEGFLTMSLEVPGQYVAQHIFELAPGVDIETFKASCDLVVQRHAILRTRMVMVSSSRLLQVVLRKSPIYWTTESDLQKYLQDDRSRPIGLNDPLSRWALVGPGRRTFVWTLHHTSYDGTSLPLLCMHLRMTYHMLMDKTVPQLSPKSDEAFSDVPYAHFIHHLVNTDAEAQTLFWRNYLEGGNKTVYPRGIPSHYRPRPDSAVSQSITMGPKIPSDITLPTLLRGAWALVLMRHADAMDVVFDMVDSGRSAPVAHIETVVGPTIATVPVRIAVESLQTPVDAFLSAIQADAAAMTAHVQFGLQNIQKISPATHVLCSNLTLLVIQPPQDQETDPSSVIWQPVGFEGSDTFHSHALTLVCTILTTGTINEVLLEAFFDSTVLDKAEAQCLLAHLAAAVFELNAMNDKTVEDIDITSDYDLEQIWQMNSLIPQTIPMRIHDLVRWQMFTKPQAQAVEACDGSLTYAELDILSSNLANHLLSFGVLPGSVIPILVEKSFWSVVAVLAVLRAGAAFVLIDTSHPEDRVRHLMRMIEPLVVVASMAQRPLSARLGIPVAELLSDKESSWSASPENDWQSVNTSPNSLAYVIFTSGSTGEPKAACIQHKAYCSGAAGHIAATALSETSRVLQFASYAFDDSIKDILSTLLVGGCICVPSEIDRMSNLANFMAAKRVNWAHLTPSFARSLDPQSMPRTFQTLLLGGEPMSSQDVLQWSPYLRLINAYGPSELCVTCSVNPTPTPLDPTNIGRPVGCVAWVCDPGNPHRLAPYGTTGELLIEGPLQCSGYLHNAASTAAAFVENPAFLTSKRPGNTRLYRTGDLVRYNHDQSLVYLGRKDSQVKIRGQRVELGEVESQLHRRLVHPWQAVVEFITTDQTSFLAAFLYQSDSSLSHQHVPSINCLPLEMQKTVADIDFQISQSLPRHMKPSFYLSLGHLPQTRTGKTDRRLLKDMAAAISSDEWALHVPQKLSDSSPLRRPLETKLEKLLQLIWTETLNRDLSDITPATSFFAVGGDSISAIQVLNRLRHEGIEISLHEVLQQPILGGICDYIEAISHQPDLNLSASSIGGDSQGARSPNSSSKDFNSSWSSIPSPSMTEVQTSFPLSPIQRLFFSMNPDGNNAEQLSLLVKVSPEIESSRLFYALESLTSIHDAFRLRFTQDEAGQWRQSVLDTSTLASNSLIIAQHVVDGHEESVDLCTISSTTRDYINIETGQLVAAALISCGSEQHLFLTAHHLVIDLVSWRIILHDLDELLSKGLTTKLNRSLSYMEWCTLQAGITNCGNAYESSDDISIDSDYWALSCRPSAQYITRRVELSPVASRALTEGCHSGLGVMPHEAFQAALLYSFQKVFEDRSIPALFSSSHGRHLVEDADLSHTVGWCTVFYPVQVKPEVSPTSLQQMIRLVHDEHATQKGRAWQWFDAVTKSPRSFEYGLGEIAFNYTGQYQSFEESSTHGSFHLVPWNEHQESMVDQSASRQRTALFEVVVGSFEGTVCATVSFSPDLAHQERIEQWIVEFGKACEQTAALSNMRSLVV